MNLRLKSKQQVKSIVFLAPSLLLFVVVFWYIPGTIWTGADFRVLDMFYQYALNTGHTGEASSHIVYLTITDDTYRDFAKNYLDRAYLAKVNAVLAELFPEAVLYDMVFDQHSTPEADQAFAESLEHLERVYLPTILYLSGQPKPFQWDIGSAYEKFRTYLKQPVERGNPHPMHATKAIMQWDRFAEVAYNSGHINAPTDPDGVHRHFLMLIRVDSQYIPTLSLALFLDYMQVSFDEVIVDWGHEIRIPASEDSYVDEDVVIPIDDQGRAFIPFIQRWGQDFEQIPVHKVLEYSQEPNLSGNLELFFESKFVFIGDVSLRTSDTGKTPIEDNVPLVAIHTALLNGLLTNTFYHTWSFEQIIIVLCIISAIFMLSALPKSSWFLYMTGLLVFSGLIGFTWDQFIHFTLFPIVMVSGTLFIIFFGLIIGLHVTSDKERYFVRNAFSKYVPENVVSELLDHPEKLTLGGEEREISILFSDVQGFTTISESMTPTELVHLLNEYLSEMTDIIIEAGGIIDKYEGDAIMAEFGVPLPLPEHADRAVSAALKMQRRLHELRTSWAEKGLPELQCRIGINTGIVVVGNMGSRRVFDYTVIGDAANLASRLEGANKLYNTSLMISEFTYNALTPDRFQTRVLDVIKVKGKSNAVKVYEVYGEDSESLESDDLAYYHAYENGFNAYLSRNFTRALEQFALAIQLRPKDPAAKGLIYRIAALDIDELAEDWDGSIALTTK